MNDQNTPEQVDLFLRYEPGDSYEYTGEGRTERHRAGNIQGCLTSILGMENTKNAYHEWEVQGRVDVQTVDEGHIRDYLLTVHRHREEWQEEEGGHIHRYGEALDDARIEFRDGEGEMKDRDVDSKEIELLTYRLSRGNLLFRMYESLYEPRTVSEGDAFEATGVIRTWKRDLQRRFEQYMPEDSNLSDLRKTGGSTRFLVEEMGPREVTLSSEGDATFKIEGEGEEETFTLDLIMQKEATIRVDHREHCMLAEENERQMDARWDLGDELGVVKLENERHEGYEFDYVSDADGTASSGEQQ